MTKAEVILNAINSGATDEELAVLENTPEEQFTVESVADAKKTTATKVEEPVAKTTETITKDKPSGKVGSQNNPIVSKETTKTNSSFDLISGFDKDTQSVQDRTTTINYQKPVVEINENAPLQAKDFYDIAAEKGQVPTYSDGEEISTDEYEDEVNYSYKLPPGAKYIDSPMGGGDYDVDYSGVDFNKLSGIDFNQLNGKAPNVINKKKVKDKELLLSWLNAEYFGKEAANSAMGTDNIIAYSLENLNIASSDLIKDFKSNLDNYGTGRTSFPSLTDSDLDIIFLESFDSQLRASKAKIDVDAERKKVDSILTSSNTKTSSEKAIVLEESIKKMVYGEINSFPNKLEAQYAQNLQKLRDGNLSDEDTKKLLDSLDADIVGSLGDLLFNETTFKFVEKNGKLVKTFVRTPKDVDGNKVYHDPVSGKVLNASERTAAENNGKDPDDITDSYELYLQSFKNTSQDDLSKYNNRLLLRKAGYDMEGSEVGDYYVGDKIMRHELNKKGYKMDSAGNFLNVPMSVLTRLSDIPSSTYLHHSLMPEGNFDVFMTKGEITPLDFKNKPYQNKEEFLEFLQVRRQQGGDIAAQSEAIKQIFYLNRDPGLITKNRLGQVLDGFMGSAVGKTVYHEAFGYTNQAIIETIRDEISINSDIDLTDSQKEHFEDTFADEMTKGAGGMGFMLLALLPVNRVAGGLGINRAISSFWLPTYRSITTGKNITQAVAIKEAAKRGMTLDVWAASSGHTIQAASSLNKGIGIATAGIVEDVKMREVMGAMTDGRLEFERGVGFGFSIAPRLLPYGFGQLGRGKTFDLTTRHNQLNTFLQSTFVNAPSFALAVEGGDALGALVNDFAGKQEYSTWAEEHWGDRDKNARRIGSNLLWGKLLGAMHFNYMDVKTTADIGKFQLESIELASKDLAAIDQIVSGDKGSKQKKREIFIAENPNSKEVRNLQKHLEDFNMSTQRLDLINNSAEWLDPVMAKKTYENHYKPLVDLFKSKGKSIEIEVTDQPLYQEIIKNGKVTKQEVNALYTRLSESKNGIARIQINTKKSKGKQTANHEGLHAYLDLMFEGNIKLKEQFTNSFKQALESIKTPNSNLFLDIVNTKDVNKIDKLEEMMAYAAEYLGKAEHYNDLVSNQAFIKIKKFWNNFAESSLGHKADLTLKQDIIDLLGTYGRTGDLKKLESLNEIIEYDPTGKVREGQVASTDINKTTQTIQQIQTKKTDIQQEIRDLRIAKPKGYENIIDQKYAIYAELNASQKKLENKVEIDAVSEVKDGWKNQIDKNYTVGKYVDLKVGDNTIPAKQVFQDQQQKSLKPVAEDIRTSKGLENTIRQAANLMKVPIESQPQFIKDVKDKIIERFLKNYDPGKVNQEFGRELTPFEYLTTRPPKGESIIYRSAGDVAKKYKETLRTASVDATKGGWPAIEGYSEQTGYMNTSETFDSKVEREGIELSREIGMNKVMGTKKVNGETVNVTLGDVIDSKSGADAKNLNFEATEAKNIVSYKNIQANAERTIGKEVTVDYYGVSVDMYSKMLKNESQQLNNPDIENVLSVIKNNIEVELNQMPLWKQSIIDKYTGKEVAFDIVSGKFASEPKATGITNSVLKLKDVNGNGLIYKELPQTGTKGSKYEFSQRYKQYLETFDPVMKKQFELDVIEALSSGNKAEISGKLKGWIMQRKKAMYVQGVDKALPKSPELTARFSLAEMTNQITAGKNPKLASLGTLLNTIYKNINKDFAPSLISFDTLFSKPVFNKHRKNGDIKFFLEEWHKIESRKAGFQESVEVQAEIMYEGRSIESTELKAIETSNFKDMAIKLRALGGDYKDIDVNAPLYAWSADPNLVIKQNKFEAALGNMYPSDAGARVISALGNGKNKRVDPITGKEKLISYDKNYELTIGNWYKSNLGAVWTGNGYTTNDAKFSWMKEFNIINTGDFKTKLANENLNAINEGKTDQQRIEIIHRIGREMVAGKTKDFNTVLEANKKYRLFHLNSIKEVIDNHKSYGLTRKEATEAALRHIRHQTDITDGPIKGTATITAVSMEVGIPVGKDINAKNFLGTMYHAEHQLQLMNHSYTFFEILHRNKSNKKGFKKELGILTDLFEQSITVKQDQLIYDSQSFGGNTGYLKEFKNKNLGEVLSILNIMYTPGILPTIVDLRSPNAQTVAETILQNYSKRQLEILLNHRKDSPNALHYFLNHKNNNRGSEIESRKVLNRSIGKEMANTVATKDLNKVIKAVNNAIKLGKNRDKVTKGMSTWDFDGTLATTKSGVRATIPNPSGKPKPNRKVIFMAGGAGSGKGNVIKKLDLQGQGFKVVNSDISLEWLKKNNGLPENMNDFTPEQRSLLGSLQHQARGIAKNKMMKYKGNADGVVVDGTGGSIKVMEGLVKEFKDNGYDVSMVFVETSLETALARNATRAERSLLDVIVRKNHEAVQGNKDGFKTMFGERFMEVNTDNVKQADAMPTELISKMKDFVSGYEKVRLDAEQFANEGKSILDAGGKFDFAEFNVVTEGAQGPMFQTALNRAKKFGTKDQFILTARPQEAALPIYEFLKSQGLEIPIENITGLGNSTGEAKALWMIKKFAEGYNDMYFADDVMQNTSAVKSALDKLQVKSKVVLAKGKQEQQLNNIKNPDKLDSPGVYQGLASRNLRAEYEKTISKLRPDLVKEGSVSRMVDEMFDFIDTLKIPENKKRKYEQITTKWLATGNIRIKEDAFRVKEAMELADRYKEDVFSYRNPNEIIEKYAGKVKVKPTVPRSTKEFTLLNDAPLKERGVEEVMIADSRNGQAQARKIVNRHWGNESNPWCLTQVKDGKLTEDAWTMWTSYDKGPKHLVFHDGKLIAFKADNVYWDRMNHRTEGVMINVKEGRVTHRTELTRESTTKPSGVEVKSAIEPVIRETRTVSEDGNTVKTEIFENSKDGYTEGTVLIENRTKGVRTKETRFDPDGTKVSVQEFDKAGKPTTSYEFSPDGKIKSVNGHLQKQAMNDGDFVIDREDVIINLADNLVKKVGDILEKNYTEKDVETGVVTDYFYGRVSLDGKVVEIGFESKSNLDLADVTKTVDGKTRIDINKVLEVDPTLKGLPKDFKPSGTGMQNIKIVKQVLDQLDIKSDVQQGLASKNLNKSFNDIIEQTTKVESEKVFSDAQAKIRGAKKRYDSIMPASVQDLGGLLYNFLGKGKVGEKQMEFFKENLIDPFSKGINELNQSRQATSNDYNNLLKSFPDVKSKLNKSIEGSDFTYDQAIRVHLWNKAGFEVPGLSKRDLNALDSVVKNNPELQAFADLISAISKKEAGYSKPSKHWLVENLTSELLSGEAVSQSRSEFLAEWKQNSSEIFSKENLNKIQATYGNKFREALEDILYRMENGTNRPTGSSRLTNNFMNWINNSTGAIMFFNMRSALLQTLSTTNYINWAENNPLKAAAAFANQKQYWKDFSELFNSDFLKQRRSGNQRSINEAELSAAVANSDSKPKAALAWLLQKGFLPTQIADSFAIASGGSTFYRNRINKYIKEGMSPEQAREKAFLDFQEITEATQQSARPDMISQQQASPLGRLILSFQNTPMQYARIMNKAARDLAAGRGDAKHNISKIVYYGALQSIIFGAMQSAIFASLGDDEEEEFDKKKERIMYSMVDGWLAGLGVTGKAVGTVEKSIREYLKQKERGFNADHAQTIIQLLGFSPPIGSKLRKIYSAIQTEEFNKGVSEKRGFTLDNPTWSTYGNVVEGFTNVPMGRIANKMLNIDNALDSQNQWWERAALLLGWNTWDLGIKDTDITAVKGEIKEERKVEKKKEAVIKKEEKKQEIKEENISKEEANIEIQKKEIEDGNKSPDCAAINKRGERCGTKIEKGSTYCTIHAKVEQSDGGKKTQCGKTKENGKRCKMQTTNKSGYCYYHD
jgi:hypothetical protein